MRIYRLRFRHCPQARMARPALKVLGPHKRTAAAGLLPVDLSAGGCGVVILVLYLNYRRGTVKAMEFTTVVNIAHYAPYQAANCDNSIDLSGCSDSSGSMIGHADCASCIDC